MALRLYYKHKDTNMTFVTVSIDDKELIYNRFVNPKGEVVPVSDYIELPPGTIAKLIGKELTYEDKPIMQQNEPQATSLEFNEDNKCFPEGTLLRIFEVNENAERILLADKQGYSHKKARSIIKNLNIAYPSKKYILTRVFESEEDEQ